VSLQAIGARNQLSGRLPDKFGESRLLPQAAKAKQNFEALVTGRACHEDDSSLRARLERLEQIRKGRENRKNMDK
jgi:uncharacterized membrane protein